MSTATAAAIGNPWADAVGYMVQLPLHGTSSGNNPLLIGKRTTSNTSLAGSERCVHVGPDRWHSLFAGCQYRVYRAVDAQSRVGIASGCDGIGETRQHRAFDAHRQRHGHGIRRHRHWRRVCCRAVSRRIRTSITSSFAIPIATQVDPQPNGDLRFTNFRVDHKPIPEPTTMSLLGLAAGVLWRWRDGSAKKVSCRIDLRSMIQLAAPMGGRFFSAAIQYENAWGT